MNYVKLSDGRIIASESQIFEVEDPSNNEKQSAIKELDDRIEKEKQEIESAKKWKKLGGSIFYWLAGIMGTGALIGGIPIFGIIACFYFIVAAVGMAKFDNNIIKKSEAQIIVLEEKKKQVEENTPETELPINEIVNISALTSNDYYDINNAYTITQQRAKEKIKVKSLHK